MLRSSPRRQSKGVWSASLFACATAVLALPIACSGTLIIGEGEVLPDADSGADSPVASNGGHGGVTMDGAAGAAGPDSSAGAGGIGSGGVAGLGGAGDASESEAGEASAGSGGNPGPIACGSSLCAKPSDCCFLDASCFDPTTEPGACPAPADDGSDEGKPCGADSHCAPGEYCRNTNKFSCVGPGRCTGRDVDSCNAVAIDNETCSCDGVTRPERKSCQLGIRSLCGGPAQCGQPISFGHKTLYYCGNDPSWCPAGLSCCGITGYCYDPAVPDLCVVPPAWGLLPCVADEDCPGTVSFCQGTQCGAPGACKPALVDCEGSLEPVCGCNGKTYMNQACADNDRVATDYVGWCPDSGL